jgi:hypothetical protein
MALNSSTVSSGDLATAAQYNNLRTDATGTSSGHVHDGTLGIGSSLFKLLVAGLPLDLQNTTDAVSNQGLKVGGGNRGTPADNDEVYLSLLLDDHLGAQTEFVRLTAKALDVTNTSKDSRLEAQYYTANTLRELIFPAITADDTVVVLALAQTLINKTLTSPVINTQLTGSAVGTGGSQVAQGSHTAPAASATASGHAELATIAETNTGTDATRVVTADGLAGSVHGTRAVEIFVFDITASATVGNSKGWFRVPALLAGMNIVTVHAEARTAGTTGNMDIQLRNETQSADILSTVMRIETGETGTDTSAQPGVIDTGQDDLQENDVIFVDVDTIQTGTAALGLLVTLECRLP